jgi:hypothetical protein
VKLQGWAGLSIEKNVACLHGFVAMSFNEGQSRHRDRFQLHPSRTDKLALEAAGFEVFGQMRKRESTTFEVELLISSWS